MPEDKTAKGAGHKAHGKGRKCQDGTNARRKGREKQFVEHKPGDYAVEEKVIPFDDRAHQGRNNYAAQVCLGSCFINSVAHVFSPYDRPSTRRAFSYMTLRRTSSVRSKCL